jgi:hypothetical protein
MPNEEGLESISHGGGGITVDAAQALQRVALAAFSAESSCSRCDDSVDDG